VDNGCAKNRAATGQQLWITMNPLSTATALCPQAPQPLSIILEKIKTEETSIQGGFSPRCDVAKFTAASRAKGRRSYGTKAYPGE
jgi:hypothetical protein